MKSYRRTLMFFVVVAASLSLASCSGEESSDTTVGVSSQTTNFSPSLSTLETTGATAGQYEETTGFEETTVAASESVTLRFEGSEGVRFDGRCEFGGGVRRVAGRVPARLTLDAGDSALSCDIDKLVQQGQLRVILTSDGTTRSVQQVGPGRGMLRVSYDPSGSDEA